LTLVRLCVKFLILPNPGKIMRQVTALNSGKIVYQVPALNSGKIMRHVPALT